MKKPRQPGKGTRFSPRRARRSKSSHCQYHEAVWPRPDNLGTWPQTKNPASNLLLRGFSQCVSVQIYISVVPSLRWGWLSREQRSRIEATSIQRNIVGRPRKAGFSATVSPRALIILAPMLGSLAQDGIRPQRIGNSSSPPSGSWRTIGRSWVGAALKRRIPL